MFPIGWNLWALEFYTSLITGNLFSTSSPFKAFWENLQLCLLETQEPFRTTCATSFRAHPATAGRVPATDAECGLSTRGHWDGPVICNEWRGGGRWHCATVRHEVRSGERFHVNTIIHHVWGLLPSDKHVLCICHLDLQAVHR